MQWGPEARLAACQAAFGLLDGGRLCLYAGERKAAELTFAHPCLHGGTLRPLAPDESAAGARNVDRFVALSAEGAPVAEGTVGLIGSGADIELKSVHIPHGARVEPESLHFAPGDA